VSARRARSGIAAGSERAADPDQRTLGPLQHRGQPVKVFRARPGEGRGSRRVERRLGLLLEQILGQDHRDRAGGAALGDVEGAGDGLARHLRLVHLDDQLGDVGQQPRVVLLLQGETPEIPALHLPDQHHHRRRVVVGGVQADHAVGEARTARDDADAGAPLAHAPVGGGHERGTPLVAADDQAGAVVVDQRVGQAEIALARHAVDQVDVVGVETVDQQARDRAAHGSLQMVVSGCGSGRAGWGSRGSRGS